MNLLPLLALPAFLAVVAFHLVHPNTRQLRVSMSAILPEPPKSDAPKRQFSLTLLVASVRFWIRIVALFLVGAALYPFLIERPMPPKAPNGVRIVMDLSPSVALGPAGGPTRFEQELAAYDQARKAIAALDDEGEPPCVDIAFVDGSGLATVVLADAAIPSTHAPGHDGMAADALTSVLGITAPAGCPVQASHAVILTDQPPRFVSPQIFPGHIIWHQVGIGLPNVGLTGVMLAGGGLSGTDATLMVRAASHGGAPKAVNVTLSGATGTQEIALSPEESGGDGWTASVPFIGAGDYELALADGGAYSGDDRMILALPDAAQVAVDWRLADLRQPQSLARKSAAEGGVLVARQSDVASALPEGPFVLVYEGWSGRSGGRIGPFIDDHPILDQVNFDVLERRAPGGSYIPVGFDSGLDIVMRGDGASASAWIAARENPPGAIIPFGLSSGDDAALLSRLLLANALRFAAGGRATRQVAAVFADEEGVQIRRADFEAETARDLALPPGYALLSEPPRPTSTVATEKEPIKHLQIAPWLMAAGLLMFLIERIVGPVWARRKGV